MVTMKKVALPQEAYNTAKSFLQSSSFFSGWSETDLDAIMQHTQTLQYEDGSVIFQPNDHGARLYLLLNGNVEILSPNKKNILAEFVTGELFGEISLLNGKPQDVFAIARKNTQLVEFPKDGASLESLYSDTPEILVRLYQSLLIFTSQRTRAANTLIKENSPVVRELRNQVYNDKLTGLYNRTYLHESFTELSKDPFALIMMKPDNFKYINDTFGHEAGDSALVLMGAQLKKRFSNDAVLVRYEGNEFAVLTYLHTEREDAYAFAQTIKTELETFDLSRLFNGEKVFLSMSLGVVLYPEHGKTDDIINLCAGMPLIGRHQGGSVILFPEDC